MSFAGYKIKGRAIKCKCKILGAEDNNGELIKCHVASFLLREVACVSMQAA